MQLRSAKKDFNSDAERLGNTSIVEGKKHHHEWTEVMLLPALKLMAVIGTFLVYIQ
jgi:hypothetical protein